MSEKVPKDGRMKIAPKTPFNETSTPVLDEGLKVNHHPLQIGSQDTILRRYTLGGPENLRDTRMYLDRADLEFLLEKAKVSPTGRVVLPCAGFDWELRKSRDGHLYEVVKITSREPQPERMPSGLITPHKDWDGRTQTQHQWQNPLRRW